MFYERDSREKPRNYFLLTKNALEKANEDNKGLAPNISPFGKVAVSKVNAETNPYHPLSLFFGEPSPLLTPALKRHNKDQTLGGKGEQVVRSRTLTATATSSPNLKAPNPSAGDHGHPLRVLVADDNLLIRTSLLSLLEKWQFEHTICENGQAAWALLQKEKFDLLLIDLQMPFMDGHEVVAQVRRGKNGPNQQIPIVAMAGSPEEEAKAKMMKAGACYYLRKPLAPQELYQIITRFRRLEEHQHASLYTDLIDHELLREVYDNDTIHLEMMLGLFLRNTPEAMVGMETAIVNKEWEDVEKAIHKIKPTFAMVGLRRIGEFAEKLEQHLNEQKHCLKHNFYAEFKQFQVAVNQGIQTIAQQQKSLQDLLK